MAAASLMAEAEARAPTWAEARAMEKRLCLLRKKINEDTTEEKNSDPAQQEADKERDGDEASGILRHGRGRAGGGG